MYDIAIVGLGPAGSTFARLVDSRKYKVAAFDRKAPDHPEKHAKPCGGLLAPDAQRALARFGLSIPQDVIASPQIFYVKTIDLDSGLTNNYQRFYLNIDRSKFDLWMMSQIPDSVDVYSDTQVTRIWEEAGTYNIEFRRDGHLERVSAKYIVGADGAKSVVSRQFFSRDMQCFRLCIQESYAQNDQAPFFSCIFDSQNSDSYSWTLSKDGHFIFGGAYAIKGGALAFERQKQNLKRMDVHLSGLIKREACLVYRPHAPRDIFLGREHVLLLGEAAGFISPSSFEGISGALNSAYLLSRVFNSDTPDILKAYKKSSLKLRIRYLMKIVKAHILFNRVLRRFIMKSQIKHIEVIR